MSSSLQKQMSMGSAIGSNTTLDTSTDKGLVKNQREYAFYKEMFSQLIDIVDAIITQITEKVSILPYKVRQFCKCIYQMTYEKFGKE